MRQHRANPSDLSGRDGAEQGKKVRARRMIREVRSLGYRVDLLLASSSRPA
jgi:hypothetical protein